MGFNKIDFIKIEKKWQKKWEEKKVFVSKKSNKKKFYCLEMFPYPSGKLHMGHMRNYSIGDCIARFRRMQGFNVIYPMGYDAFGLPAENAAIKNKADPNKWTLENIEAIKSQQKSLGLSYDWTREVITCLPEYYKWNQYIFLKMFEKGLAYKKKSPVNWCPKCSTVLANEQVEEGKCWRCESIVEERELDQWYFKITDYADELLKDIEKLEEWPERVKIMQKNWIGKSKGVDIYFKLDGSDKVLSAFTTRCDTIYSVTFLVIAPESPLVDELTKGTKYEKDVKKFIKDVKKDSIIDRINEEKEKKGIFLGKYAINPVNKKKIPIYTANFALMYGSGVIMCNAHDKRDFAFAKKYKIPLKFVISKDGKKEDANKSKEAYVDDGILFDSGIFSGMNNREALPKIADWLEKNKYGKKTFNYKIRDWLISRQRYWGTPIPVIYCDKCDIVPVPEKDLPVKLPEDVKFGKGNPLETSKFFVNVKCPKCGGKARRETDTMDTFVDSSWYFLRYCSPKSKKIFEKDEIKYWMPVDQYIGGIEHAILHLLYARFIVKVLRDLKLLDFDEPFSRLLAQGMITKDGAKMSKSKGNVVSPEEITSKFGADTARFFILFEADPEKELEWTNEGVQGSYRFLNRVYSLLENKSLKSIKDKVVISKLHSTIKSVTENIERNNFNLALGSLMGFTNYLNRYKEYVSKKVYNEVLKNLALLLNPFTPHLSEEIWSKLGYKTFSSLEKWPKFDPKKINQKIEEQEKYIDKTMEDVRNILNLVKNKPKKVYLYTIPKELDLYKESKDFFEKNIGLEFQIFAVNDKNKYDPQGKSKKTKPGKPAIFVE